MNFLELQQLKQKAHQATEGSHFIFPVDTPLDQIPAIVAFLKKNLIVLQGQYSNALIKALVQTTSYPNQIYLDGSLSCSQIQLVGEHANINTHLWLAPWISVTNIEHLCKCLKPYTAIVKVQANFSIIGLMALLSSLKKGCFFELSHDANPLQIRSMLSFINQGVILALSSQLSSEAMRVINQYAAPETCFFIGKDFNAEQSDLIQKIMPGHYCMFHPELPMNFIQEMTSFIPADAGIKMHLQHHLPDYLKILPYLMPRAVVYLESFWKAGHLVELFQCLPESVAIRLHSGTAVDVCIFVVQNSPLGSILYIPYDFKKHILEVVINHLQSHTILCMGPQFEYDCEYYLNFLPKMIKGWWMPDPRMIENCLTHMAKKLPENTKIILHPKMKPSSAFVFSSEIKVLTELNIYPETSVDLMHFFMVGFEGRLMFSDNINLEQAKTMIGFLNKLSCYIPNPKMDIQVAKEIIVGLKHFSQVKMHQNISFADQLILIKSLNEHCILHFTETLTRDQVQSILTVIPPTVGIKMPRKFGSVQATYLARNIGLQNIIYLAHHSESLLADLLVISLKAGAMICLDSQYESEDDLMKALMGRNKQIWLMFNPNMPHARLRYLASHAPEHFRFMLHPQTDFRHAQIIGREIKQTIELNIHSSTASSLTQHFLLNYQGKIVLEALTDEKKLLDVLRCGHELQILQLPNQLANEHFPTFLEVLPPTGILHFKVVDFPKAQQIAQLVQQFKGDQVLSLEDATPIDFYEMIVSQLPAFNALYMNGYSRIEKLHLAFQVLKSNTIILLSPDIKELHAMAMIEKMGSRKDLFLMFHPAMPQFLLKKLMASMHPTTKVMVHPNSSSFFLQCFRASWNPNCILSSHFLLPIVDSLEFLNQFQNPTQLLIHPQTPPSMVAEYQALMNPQIFYCLSEDLNTEMIHVLAKQQNHELNLSATHDCTEKLFLNS